MMSEANALKNTGQWIACNFLNKMNQGKILTRYQISNDNKANLTTRKLLTSGFHITHWHKKVDKDLDKLQRGP